VTSRIQQKFTLETDNERSEFLLSGFKTWSNVSYQPFFGFAQCVPTWGYSCVERNGNTFSWWTSYAGSNPLIPGPEIDVHSQFEVTEDRKNGTLDIAAKIVGDGYPSAEAFVKDSKGQAVFLGIFHYQGSVATSLWGTNERDMIKANFQILIDKDGNFSGVKMNGKQFSIEQWNALVSGKAN
jgi:hypothetical protein